MNSSSLIRVVVLGLAGLFSLGTMAEPYTRVPGPTVAKEPAIVARAPAVYATFLQTCTTDINVQSCVNNGSLGGVYTSDSAYSALASLGCTYKYARSALYNKPGMDVYNCTSGNFVGATVFVFLEGNFSTSPAWTISIIY